MASQSAVHDSLFTVAHFTWLQFTSGLHRATTHPAVASHWYVSSPTTSGQTWGAPRHTQSGTMPQAGAWLQTSAKTAQWRNSGFEQSAHGAPGSQVGQQASS